MFFQRKEFRFVSNMKQLSEEVIRSSYLEVSCKKGVLKIRRIHRKTPVPDSLFKWSYGSHLPTLLKKETLTQVFSCEFCEIFKNIFFTEHLRASASVFMQSTFFKDCFCLFQWLIHSFFSYQSFWMQLVNLDK